MEKAFSSRKAFVYLHYLLYLELIIFTNNCLVLFTQSNIANCMIITFG